jgi:gamma-glutamylcysteine synthetase
MLAVFRGLGLKEWLKRIVRISYEGLERRGFVNEKGQSEAIYLEPLIANLV